jgi:hypothetical protein
MPALACAFAKVRAAILWNHAGAVLFLLPEVINARDGTIMPADLERLPWLG